MQFKLVSNFKPSGDQPAAIAALAENFQKKENPAEVLLGVTGSGKTFVMANVIEQLQKPTLIISPNKVLAAQLYSEFKTFFPANAVEYFISYYDYYQPEAYIPASDTYIEKDASINDYIDRLRLKATMSILERKDVVVVASVSCIYNLGSPKEYKDMCVEIVRGTKKPREQLLRELISIYYQRNEVEFIRGRFRVKGDTVEIFPAYLETAVKVEFFGDEIEAIKEINPLTGEVINKKDKTYIYPAKHFVTGGESVNVAIKNILAEMELRTAQFKAEGKILEAHRIAQRTKYDMEMLKETGFCNGIENYSRHLSGKPAGARPSTLIDYFYEANGSDFNVMVDESHITLPQVRGMYEGDRSRKQTLIDFGFRLPSALDNRPLKFSEFESLVNKMLMVSATPGPYELERAKNRTTELIIRPTGLVDPEIIIRPTDGQILNLMEEIKKVTARKQRVLVTTLTKKMSEDLSAFLKEKGFRTEYLHSEIDSFTRIDILKNLRLGNFDVLVGINLLREGLDLPEVSLVVVLDADKEGFLRSEQTLIQICGRAARNVDGKVIFYADKITGSMKRALAEMDRRRAKQLKYNKDNNIKPATIIKAVHDLEEFQAQIKQKAAKFNLSEELPEKISKSNVSEIIESLTKQMKQAADVLDFETAAALRDKLSEIKEMSVKRKKK
jgi:excinuclease ABC subunit B